jgi:hypothetical protein
MILNRLHKKPALGLCPQPQESILHLHALSLQDLLQYYTLIYAHVSEAISSRTNSNKKQERYITVACLNYFL